MLKIVFVFCFPFLKTIALMFMEKIQNVLGVPNHGMSLSPERPVINKTKRKSNGIYVAG